MLQTTIKRGLVALVFGAALAFSVAGLTFPHRAVASPGAQDPGGQPAEQTMEQRYKNIQALKGLPASQMSNMMNYISAALGMGCADCHVRTNGQFEFDKDDNNHKKIARRMILMTMDINKQSFNGRPQVSCYTCHQGQGHPVGVPPLPRVAAKEEARPAGEAPKPEEILAKYRQAVGGKEAAEAVKSRVIKGTSVAANGQGYPLEINFIAPDKYTLSVALPQAPTTQKFNGSSGWLKNAREDRSMDGVDMMRARSLALSLGVLQANDPNARLGFGGYGKVGDRDTVMLRGSLPDKRRVLYHFDKENGLLLRRVVSVETPIGVDPEQTDYEDYRDAGGVKVPFTIRTSYLNSNYSSLRKFTDVKHNAQVDESIFKMPESK
jgi:hypothetical protein